MLAKACSQPLRGLLPSAVATALAAAAAAQGAPPPIPVELRARFGFEGPLVAKIGDGIGGLQVADLDGDGRREAVVVDARRARLAAVRVQDGATALQAIPTDGQIAGYALADVHGDGKADLLVVDGRGRLHVRHPGGGKPSAPLDLGLGGRGLQLLTGDLDGDDKQDLVAFGRGNLRWVTRIDGTPVLSAIETVEENAYGARLLDLDGDQRLDLLCAVPAPTMNLRLRRGRGDGTFGPWHVQSLDNLRGVMPLRAADGQAALATIEGPHRRIALHRYADHGGAAALEWWSFGEGQAPRTPPFAVADLDGDGDLDLALAQADRARLLVHEWRDGTFQVRALPTLAGTTSLAAGDVDGDGKTDLVLVSPEENALAWLPGSGPLDAFPTQLPCVDKPVAACVDPQGGVLVLCRNDKRDAHLDRVVPGQEPQRRADLGRLPADPARLLAGDLGDAGGLEVAFVVPGEGLRTVTLGGGDAAAAAPAPKDGKAEAKGDTAGFTKKLEDGSLLPCTHDGQPALLAVRDRFLRRFRLDAKGQVRVLAQDNGPEGLAELSLAAPLADGGCLYLDKKNNKLVRTAPGGAATTIDVPPFEFGHLLAFGDAALLLGPRGVLRVPFGSGPTLQPVATHEPPIDRTFYWQGAGGDFDGDGRQDLAVVDGHLPGVQILAATPQGLERALAMPVFETPPSQEPDNEPRELAVGDLNGDGRDDLVLICHDRILIYLQEK